MLTSYQPRIRTSLTNFYRQKKQDLKDFCWYSCLLGKNQVNILINFNNSIVQRKKLIWDWFMALYSVALKGQSGAMSSIHSVCKWGKKCQCACLQYWCDKSGHLQHCVRLSRELEYMLTFPNLTIHVGKESRTCLWLVINGVIKPTHNCPSCF